MAFTLSAHVGSSSLTLSDGAPFSVLGATGMGGASVRRVTQQGPSQAGDSDSGYRLAPRDIELEIGFQAATDAALDTHRDTLTAFFKPLATTPVKLRVTRDDGGVRQIDCYVRGPVDITLTPDLRPGHYHRARVRLRAADPAWYGTTPGTATAQGTPVFSPTWYLAGGAIGSANVLMHGSVPAQNEAWSYTGTILSSQSYTLAVRAGSVTASGAQAHMFQGSAATEPQFYRVTDTAGHYAGIPLFRYHVDTIVSGSMAPGTQNYFFTSKPAPVNGVALDGPGPVGHIQSSFASPAGSINGAAMRWRTNSWPGTIQLYALYDIGLSGSQRNALNASMAGTSGTISQSVVVPYDGDLPEYPVISITGPISSPSLTNTATAETLDFGTITIGAGTTYVIDTRYGIKTVLAGTVSKRGELTEDSDLDTWHLAPDPVATGGTNSITVYGTATGTATTVSIVYYNRYMSF